MCLYGECRANRRHLIVLGVVRPPASLSLRINPRLQLRFVEARHRLRGALRRRRHWHRPNLAPHLCGEAKAGQSLISQRLLGTIDDLAECEPLSELTLKGLNRPITGFNVLADEGLSLTSFRLPRLSCDTGPAPHAQEGCGSPWMTRQR